MAREPRERSFDELAIGLASGTLSRGRALRLMGAALVGGTLGSLGIGEAGADQCKRAGKACKKNSQCCSGNCSGGKCVACPSGQVLCSNGSCVSNSCPTGQIFNTTSCKCECASGQVLCPQGYCGRYPGGSCAAGELCCAGNCEDGKCCVGSSVSCTTSNECCGGLSCINGSCGI